MPTLEFDVFIDTYFIADIIMTFFVVCVRVCVCVCTYVCLYGQLAMLRICTLANNQLTWIPNQVGNMNSVTEFVITGNPLRAPVLTLLAVLVQKYKY